MLAIAHLSAQTSTPEEQYWEEDYEGQSLDASQWETITKDLDYTPKKLKEKEKVKRDSTGNRGGGNDQLRSRNNSRNWGEASKVWLGIMKLLLILSIVFILFVLLRNVLGITSTPRNRKLRKSSNIDQIDIEKIEENLHESDLERFIRQALEQQNYALAIRLYYLAILKELSLSKAIHWKKNKTNRRYLMEMKSSPLSADFKDLTRVFERIWYGNHSITDQDYKSLEPRFRSFVDRINVK